MSGCCGTGGSIRRHIKKPLEDDTSDPWLTILHVMPIALLQLIDFGSDVLVILELFLNAVIPNWLPIAACACIGTSILIVICGTSVMHEGLLATPQIGLPNLSCRRKLIIILLAPLNLHVLGIGVMLSRERAEHGPQTEEFYKFFCICKVIETGLESIPVGIITLGALGYADATVNMPLLLSSCLLSMLSAAYGFYAYSALMRGKTQFQYFSRGQLQLFMCVLVHTSYAFLATGFSLQTFAGVYFVAALLGVGFVQWCSFCVLFVAQEKKASALIVCFVTFPFAFVFAFTDWCVLDEGFIGGIESWNGKPWFKAFPFLRRFVLFAAVVTTVTLINSTEEDVSPWRSSGLLVLMVADVLAFQRSFVIVGIIESDVFDRIARLCRCKSRRIGAQHSPVDSGDQEQAEVDLAARLHVEPNKWPEQKRGLYDALEEVHRQEEKLIRMINFSSDGKGIVALRDVCETVILALPQMANATLYVVHHALTEYLPVNDVAKETLLGHLRSALESSKTAGNEYMHREKLEHPMRAVTLVHALVEGLWLDREGARWGDEDVDFYKISKNATRSSYFVSHCWRDPGDRKLEILRNVICLQQLAAGLCVSLPLVALMVLPFGFALTESTGFAYAWTVASGVPLLQLVLGLLWVFISSKGWCPAKLAPWAFASTTLWIDKCCISQASPDMIKAGAEGFPRFLGHCDNMVAFVSKTYFSRLWCTFELAYFCSKNADNLDDKLLLLGLHWPVSMLSKTAKLDADEVSWLKNYSCRKAECFKPIDRATVLSMIRREWGSEAHFDQFVHEKLTQVLERSKKLYTAQFMNTVLKMSDALFG